MPVLLLFLLWRQIVERLNGESRALPLLVGPFALEGVQVAVDEEVDNQLKDLKNHDDANPEVQGQGSSKCGDQ